MNAAPALKAVAADADPVEMEARAAIIEVDEGSTVSSGW